MSEPLKLFGWEPKEMGIQYPNPSGYRPLEHKVLIDPAPVMAVTKGGVILPDSEQTTQKFKQTRGRIVAVSPFAFSYVSNEEWGASGMDKPKPGDLVLYAQYAGIAVKGMDGREYTLANDVDVCSLIEE